VGLPILVSDLFRLLLLALALPSASKFLATRLLHLCSDRLPGSWKGYPPCFGDLVFSVAPLTSFRQYGPLFRALPPERRYRKFVHPGESVIFGGPSVFGNSNPLFWSYGPLPFTFATGLLVLADPWFLVPPPWVFFLKGLCRMHHLSPPSSPCLLLLAPQLLDSAHALKTPCFYNWKLNYHFRFCSPGAFLSLPYVRFSPWDFLYPFLSIHLWSVVCSPMAVPFPRIRVPVVRRSLLPSKFNAYPSRVESPRHLCYHYPT